MKKIFLLFAAVIFMIACEKNDPKPAPAAPVSPAPTTTHSTTPTGAQKYTYSWNYKKANDPNEYSGMSCLTEDEMLNKQQLEGAYNIRNWGPC